MKRSITLSVLILTFITSSSIFAFKVEPNSDNKLHKGILFNSISYQDALELSKKEGKPIFVDVYATWCGPCKLMSRLVFTNNEVGAYYNENFINLKIDAEKDGGKAFARKYRIQAYPTLMFIDSTGNVFYRTEGARQKNEFIDLGKQALKNYKPNTPID